MFSLLSKRKTLHIVVLTLLFIGFGIFYNCKVMDNSYPFYLPYYLMVLSAIVLFSFVAMFVVGKVFDIDWVNAKISRSVFWSYSAVIGGGIGAVAFFSKNTHFTLSVLKNSAFVVSMYPIIMLYTKQTLRETNLMSILEQTLILIWGTAIGYFAGGLKMAAFTFAIIIIAESISLKMNSLSNKRRWKIHLLIVCCIGYFALCGLSLAIPGMSIRLIGILNPRYLPEYSFLVDSIKDFELFAYFPNNDFVYHIHSPYAAPYAQLLYCFGLVFTVFFVVLQVAGVVLMIKRSFEFLNENRKYLGIMSATTMSLQLLLSLSSSFFKIPLSEWGALFTIKGLEFCLFPLCLFFLLELQERNLSTKALWETLKDLIGLGVDDDFDIDEFDFCEHKKEYSLFDNRYMTFMLVRLLESTDEESRERIVTLMRDICKDAALCVSSHYNDVSFDREDEYRKELKEFDDLLESILNLKPGLSSEEDDLAQISATILNWHINRS